MVNKVSVIIVLLLVILLMSLAFNYVLYKKAFLPLHMAKLDPIGLNYYRKDDIPTTNKPIVMFYGDSRGLSWPAPVLDQFQFVNRSIGSQTSIQVSERFSQHVALIKPDIVLLQVCVNDLKMIPLFPTQKASILANCKQNLQNILTQSHGLGSKVVLSTVFPLGDISIARKLLGSREQPIIEAIDEINAYISTLVSENTLIFDSYSLLKGEGRKIKPAYSQDWLHLSPEGYQHLNTELVSLLETLVD